MDLPKVIVKLYDEGHDEFADIVVIVDKHTNGHTAISVSELKRLLGGGPKQLIKRLPLPELDEETRRLIVKQIGLRVSGHGMVVRVNKPTLDAIRSVDGWGSCEAFPMFDTPHSPYSIGIDISQLAELGVVLCGFGINVRHFPAVAGAYPTLDLTSFEPLVDPVRAAEASGAEGTGAAEASGAEASAAEGATEMSPN